jgi:hypothetical protein
VRGGESRDGHHPVDIDALGDEGLADGQLIGCERTGFVRAKDVDTLCTWRLALVRRFDRVIEGGTPGAGYAPIRKKQFLHVKPKLLQ